jgi:hypothetical protein
MKEFIKDIYILNFAYNFFLVNNFNGFLVKPDVESIKISLLNIMNLSNDELLLFSKNSKFLSRSINPKLTKSNNNKKHKYNNCFFSSKHVQHKVS